MYEVYKNIKRARKLRGWSQSEMAARLGYADKTAISKIVLCFTNAVGQEAPTSVSRGMNVRFSDAFSFL